MNQIENNNISFHTLKNKGAYLLKNAAGFLENAISIFKKDESNMTTEEKIEKQHMLNFIYGMGAGVIIYHFLIGAVLLLGIIWFYNLSLKKTKVLIEETKPKKRTYKKRKTTKVITEEKPES